jgi:hypothetical protein
MSQSVLIGVVYTRKLELVGLIDTVECGAKTEHRRVRLGNVSQWQP